MTDLFVGMFYLGAVFESESLGYTEMRVHCHIHRTWPTFWTKPYFIFLRKVEYDRIIKYSSNLKEETGVANYLNLMKNKVISIQSVKIYN